MLEWAMGLVTPYIGDILKWVSAGVGVALIYLTGRRSAQADARAKQAEANYANERTRAEIDREVDRMSTADLDRRLHDYRRSGK